MTTNSTARILKAETRAREINSTPRRWAHVEYRSLPFNVFPLCHVRMFFGTVHSNGMKETALGYVDFYDDGSERTHVHGG